MCVGWTAASHFSQNKYYITSCSHRSSSSSCSNTPEVSVSSSLRFYVWIQSWVFGLRLCLVHILLIRYFQIEITILCRNVQIKFFLLYSHLSPLRLCQIRDTLNLYLTHLTHSFYDVTTIFIYWCEWKNNWDNVTLNMTLTWWDPIEWRRITLLHIL